MLFPWFFHKQIKHVQPFQFPAPVFDPMMFATSPEALTGTAALPAVDHHFRHGASVAEALMLLGLETVDV